MEIGYSKPSKSLVIENRYVLAINMVFDTPEVASKFYNDYAFQDGFGTHRGKANKIFDKMYVKWIQFICTRSGVHSRVYE